MHKKHSRVAVQFQIFVAQPKQSWEDGCVRQMGRSILCRSEWVHRVQCPSRHNNRWFRKQELTRMERKEVEVDSSSWQVHKQWNCPREVYRLMLRDKQISKSSREYKCVNNLLFMTHVLKFRCCRTKIHIISCII